MIELAQLYAVLAVFIQRNVSSAAADLKSVCFCIPSHDSGLCVGQSVSKNAFCVVSCPVLLEACSR